MIIVTKIKDTPEAIESENLAAHVILCRQKAESNDKRLDEIEDRQDKIETRERDMRSFLTRTITTALLALISSAFSIGVLISEHSK